MLARIRKAQEEEGFTLIELLVVIIIIGILAAIAIPVFLNQRKKGVDASIKSDLKSAATQVETWNNAGVVAPTTGSVLGLKPSPGNTIQVIPSTGTTGAYCMKAANPKGSNPAAGLVYDSDQGGLQAVGVGCS